MGETPGTSFKHNWGARRKYKPWFRDKSSTHKFLCSYNNNKDEDISSYNNIINHIEKDYDNPDVWTFDSITSHEDPL